MNNVANSPRRTSQLIRSLALVAVLALGATACGGADKGASSSTTAPDAKKAATALNAGLKAQTDGDLTAAAASYKKTLKYDPKNKYAFYNLALIDAASSNYGLAEKKYRSALASDPNYEPALFNLAILRTGPDPKEAVTLYQRAVKADLKDAAAWLNLGLLQRAGGDKVEGNKSVLKAISLNPKLKDPAK